MEDHTEELGSNNAQNPEHKPDKKPTHAKGHKGFLPGSPKPAYVSDRWKGNDEQAFWNFIEDTKPRVKQGSRYSEWIPTDEQRKLVTAIFERDGDRRKHRLVLAIQPRRHGKSTLFLLVVIFYFLSRKNCTIGLLGNTDDHTHRTMYKRIEAIIRNTPTLRARVNPDKNFLTDYARLQDPVASTTWQNRIIKCGVSLSGAFGDSLDILHVCDLHQTPGMESFEAWRGALIDSPEGITLVDANVDFTGGPVHELEILAETEPAVFCSHIEYADLEDYTARAPLWLDRTEARIAKNRNLDVAFKRDFLGQRSALVNRLFPEIIVKACQDKYKMPIESIDALTHGRPYAVGGGLDRAKNLVAGFTGDSTVWTTVLKVASLSGEPEYYILNQVRFALNTSKAIKQVVLQDHKRYGFKNCCLENYEVTDLRPWFADQGIECELITASDTVQNASYPELHRIFYDQRIHLPVNCDDLKSELSTFCYTQRKTSNGSYSFGHVSSKFHDDHVYSLNWAIYALRNEILDVFNLDLIDCQMHQSIKRNLCFLFGGRQVLFCSQECRAYHKVKTMFQEFKAYHDLDSELDITEFYKAYVRSNGIISYQVV